MHSAESNAWRRHLFQRYLQLTSLLRRSGRNFKHDGNMRRMKPTENEDLFRYTSGRWLWNEEARLEERYKKFNVPGLQRLAAHAVGAQSCTKITKLAEGGFNRVFRLVMDNGTAVVARIPFPCVFPASRVIASEVATMKFVRNVLDIPVPRVIAWDGHADNGAESEYILMDEAPGTQLDALWTDMELDEKIQIVDCVIDIQKKLQSVSFSKYGNIYFKSGQSADCSSFRMTGDLAPSATAYAEDLFSIGPSTDNDFWTTDKPSAGDHGPWSDALGYFRAISQRERSKISSFNESATDGSASRDVVNALDSPQARLSLLDKFDAVSPYLFADDPTLNRAVLWHWDLRAPNIFVSNGRITSLIDWQDTWAGPLLLQERRPQLVEYYGEITLRLPDEYETMHDAKKKAEVTRRVEKSIIHWYYGQEVRKRNPDLQKLFELPLARTRRETVLFASEIGNDQSPTIPLRECLYKIQRHWNELDTSVPCPIAFTPEEIQAHDKASARWNELAEFWASLEGFVSREGYTAVEDYPAARKMFEELREDGLACLSGDELVEFAELSGWAKPRDSS